MIWKWLFLFFGCFSACHEKAVKSTAGRINIEAMVYNDPQGDIYNSYLVDISTLYYLEDELVEVVKTEDSLRYSFINLRDSVFATASNVRGLMEENVFSALSRKRFGAVFDAENLPGYQNKEALPDTAFEGYDYKRIRMVTDSSYNVYYLHQTDTVFPFSFHRELEEEVGGMLNRVDAYDKTNDRFISLKMIIRDTIPESMFSFLIKKREKEKE